MDLLFGGGIMITIIDAITQLCKQHHPGEGIKIIGKPVDIVDLSAVTLERTKTLGFSFRVAQTLLAELQAAEPLRLLRVERDRLLAESDWWASSDLTMSAKRKSYRQALRDLPKGLPTEELVNNVTWPTKPA